MVRFLCVYTTYETCNLNRFKRHYLRVLFIVSIIISYIYINHLKRHYYILSARCPDAHHTATRTTIILSLF